MESQKEIEIYRQRFETFRHLDRLRWQMLQILIGIGSVSALIGRASTEPAQWWFFAVIGTALLLLAFVMTKINGGIRMNSIALRLAAEKIDDFSIPDVSRKWKTSSHWIAVIVFLAGALCLALAAVRIIPLIETMALPLALAV